MADKEGEVLVLRPDHETLEGAHAHLAAAVASDTLSGLLIVEVGKDGSVGWARFGEVSYGNLALLGAMLTHTAATKALG